MARFLLSPAAQTDVRDHWNFIGIENDDPVAADRVADMFLARLRLLAQHPRAGELAHEFQSVRKGLRRAGIGNYVIYYSVSNDNKTIEVLRILRGERDASSILDEQT